MGWCIFLGIGATFYRTYWCKFDGRSFGFEGLVLSLADSFENYFGYHGACFSMKYNSISLRFRTQFEF